MQHFRALYQDFLGLGDRRIGDATIDGTDRRALFLIEETHALGAFVGDNIVDVLLDRGRGCAVQLPCRAALVDCGVGAFGLARAAIDAFLGNQRGHFFELRTLLSLETEPSVVANQFDQATISARIRSGKYASTIPRWHPPRGARVP